MVRIKMLSDLHWEQTPGLAQGAAQDFDLVVLAGDIGQGTLALVQARQCFPHVPIVQVAGNHEFFGAVYDDALPAMRRMARRLQIDFLECDSVVHQGVEFLGCVGWTDFALYERPGRPITMTAAEAMDCAAHSMWDPRAIQVRDATAPGGVRAYRPADSRAWHQQARAWLTERLQRPAQGPRVVVTHHLPSWHSISPAYQAARSNPAFASDWDPLFAQVDLWVHGHTHSSHDYWAAGCRVVSNPRGYLRRDGRFENPDFNPHCVVRL